MEGSISQNPTTAIMPIAIANENEYNSNPIHEDDSTKQSDFAWIKDKKTSRKQNQG